MKINFIESSFESVDLKEKKKKKINKIYFFTNEME